MNEERSTVTQFLTRVLVVFSYIMLFMLIVGPLLGEQAKGESVLFELGSQGIPYVVVLQALGLSLYTNTMRLILLSDIIFKKMMLLWRMIVMFIFQFLGCGILCSLFGWFPANQPIAWAAYLLCFGISIVISITVMILLTRYEDARVSEKLEEYKEQKRKGISPERSKEQKRQEIPSEE